MIEARNISKSFPDKQVLKDVSVEFYPGKTNLVIGQSGSGKTVLLKCMVGLLEVDEGDIMFDGRVFNKMKFREKKEIRKEIGMLFQGGALFDSQTVEENVMFPLSMFTSLTYREKRDRANVCLDRVNLCGANALYPSEISGGMKKRVAIARAIAVQPKYLFCDEPNSGLDPMTALVIDMLIKEITVEYNITTVINTHDMNSILEIGDTVTFIHHGEKWWQGPSDTILDTDNPELQDFVYATKYLDKYHRKR
ncbi:MAG: ATP-binding cassette domain-containing protein [Bacteroidetes bacterium]|nr:ATP-binding cassette domain-containing protein [Bacteroidota bacterium]MBU1720784.1 ATP-binding cassette domain-containing protein [Bacteroidota bacterium]